MVRFTHLRLVGPAAVLIAILLVGLAAIPYFGVETLDAGVRERQETLVKRNISVWISDVEFALTSWTVWDEAISKVENNFDYEWVDRNMGSSLIGTSRTRFAAIIDGEDQLIYSKISDEVAQRPFFKRGAAEIVQEAHSLFGLVRASEDRVKKPGIPDPLAFSKIEVIGDDAVLLTASLFQPDFGTAKLKGKRAPILITAVPIAGSLQEFLGNRFLLDDAVVGPTSSVKPDRASVEIAIGENGKSQSLSWRPNTPARDLLRQSLPLAAALAVVFIAGAIFAVGISRRALAALVEAEKRMRHAASHDFLTGLANRSLVATEFARMTREGGLTVACLDLDGFKAINDRYGHADGDELLKQVANRLRSSCSEQDVVFRLGGDEFAILMPLISKQAAEACCRGLVAQLSRPYRIGNAVVSVGASFGVSEVLPSETDSTIAFRRADEALYQAKHASRVTPVEAPTPAEPLRRTA